MKKLRNALCAGILLLSGWACTPSKNEIILCGDDKAVIIDANLSNADSVHVVWQWKVADALSQLPKKYERLMVPLDECKTYEQGRKILLTSSGGGALLLERETGKCLFHADVPMAHSAELLPGGRAVIALSTHPRGNSIELYDLAQSETVLFRDSLYSGHGVVWMEKHERLFALGYDELRAYSLQDWDTPSPRLQLEKSWTIPHESGHDLSRISDDELLLSDHDGVSLFDIAQETFRPFESLDTARNIKSVNYNPHTRRLVYTIAEESWWTHHVYCRNADQVFNFPHIKVYKARVLEE